MHGTRSLKRRSRCAYGEGCRPCARSSAHERLDRAYTATRGFNTVALEKGVVAGEQSSRAFGWIYSNGWDLGKLELTNQSKTIWQGFAERFGEDIGYRQSGNFTRIGSDDEVEMHREWLKAALEIQPLMDSKIVTGAELDPLIPGAGEKFAAALYQASDGTAEPDYSVSRIA